MALLDRYTDRVNWVTLKEILTCHQVHGIDYISPAFSSARNASSSSSSGGGDSSSSSSSVITAADLQMVSKVAGWSWGVLYKDDALNRLGIGRFLFDLLLDLHAATAQRYPEQPFAGAAVLQRHLRAVAGDPAAAAAAAAAAVVDVNADTRVRSGDTRMLLYSGHDSTLVPLLCALGIYDGTHNTRSDSSVSFIFTFTSSIVMSYFVLLMPIVLDVWPPYASHLELEFVTESSSGRRFVRSIYNNRPMRMPLNNTPGAAIDAAADDSPTEAQQLADSTINSSSSSSSVEGGVWRSLEDFVSRIDAMAVDPEHYAAECDVSAGGGGGAGAAAASAATAAAVEELRATIDGTARPVK